MTWYPECAATPEDDGPNWVPPTAGNLMKEQQTKLTRLREAEAHQLVAREARLFHERKALKYGVNTNRGMAHFKAAMGYGNTREADGRLQEMFAQGGDSSAELPPKAVMKASKAAMKFHQGQAEKHGLNSPVGQAHVAAMQHHQAIHGKAKQQHQQMQQMKMQQQATQPRSPKVVKPPTQGQPMAAAAPGHSSKKSPVPVPKKSEQPSEDIRQNKPPIGLSPQDANKPGALRQLQQNETMGAHAGMIRAGGPGSGPQGGRHEDVLKQHGFKLRGKNGSDKRYSKGDHHIWVSPSGSWAHEGVGHGKGADSLASHLGSLSATMKKMGKEAAIRNFAREGGKGPYDNLDCTLPSKVKDQMKQNIVFRGKRTDERNKREAGYVAPRYDKSHPEGFVDKRYSDRKSGVEAGWPDRQRKMHRKMAKKSAPRVMESNRQRFPREAAIDLREFYKDNKAPKRNSGTGWRDGVSFTPTAPKVQREEVNLSIKEF